jgi:hypothetical protein
MRFLALLGVFLSLMLMGLNWVSQSSVSFFGPQAAQANWTVFFLTSIAMLVGIAFGMVHARVDANGAGFDWRRELRTTVKSAGFAKSVMIAPIVYVATYKFASTEPDTVISTLLAFQNGFFCEQIFKSRSPQIDGKPPTTDSP